MLQGEVIYQKVTCGIHRFRVLSIKPAPEKFDPAGDQRARSQDPMVAGQDVLQDCSGSDTVEIHPPEHCLRHTWVE